MLGWEIGLFEMGYHDPCNRGRSFLIICFLPINQPAKCLLAWLIFTPSTGLFWPKITVLRRSDKVKDAGVSRMVERTPGFIPSLKKLAWNEYNVVTVLHSLFACWEKTQEKPIVQNQLAIFHQFPETPSFQPPPKKSLDSWHPVLLKIYCALPTSEVWPHLRGTSFTWKSVISYLLFVNDFYISLEVYGIFTYMIYCVCIKININKTININIYSFIHTV